MVVARLLVVLAAVFTVLAMISGYIRFQALDNETFEDTASELIADEDVRELVAATLVESLYANVDVAAALEERLPPEQDRLAAPLAAATRELTDRAAIRLLNRPRVQQAWVRSVSETHNQVLRALDDELALLRTEEGLLILNLQPILAQIAERVGIVERINERLPEDAGQIEIMEAGELETAQDITQLLKILGSFLWIVPFLLAAAALWVARGRRRDIVRALAVAAVVTGMLVLFVRSLAGDYVVESLVESPAFRPAVGDVWDILTQQLADGGWTLVGLGVVLFLGAWVAGPSRMGVATRARLAPWIARPEIAFGVVAAAFLLLIWWGPTVQLRRWYLMLALAVALALGVEAIRRITAAEAAAPVREQEAADLDELKA
jgi:hypothetical protein